MNGGVILDGQDTGGQNQNILLKTQPAEHIPGFIYANAFCRACGKPPAPIGCVCAEPVHIPVFPQNAEGSRAGEELVICGAGPSLGKGIRYALRGHTGEVWAANSALNWLTERGLRVTHGIAIDPSTRMFGEVWTEPRTDVGYYLATTVNPGLTSHLYAAGCDITQFHSMRGGFDDEVKLYSLLYYPTVLTGHGLNVVNRALDLALWLGFDRIQLVGADCAFDGRQMYADGRTFGEGEDEWWVEGEIDGQMFRTKPDMLMSAVSLVQQKQLHPDRIEFVGRTLPAALQDKPQAFLDRCITWNSWEDTEALAEQAGVTL